MLHALASLPVRDVVALYVDRRGLYPSRFAEWFDDRRDARTYQGELPVIAHPPCQRWCRLAGLVEARWGHKRGDDGGLFAHALEQVRRCGGILEHPAYSDAWAAFGLPRPPTGAGWVQGAESDEWTCYVEQWRYGHAAKKATWLYYCGRRPPFALDFGVLCDREYPSSSSWAGNLGKTNWRDNVRPQLALVSYTDNHRTGHRAITTRPERKPRLTKKAARSTPPAFLDVLIALARWAVAE